MHDKWQNHGTIKYTSSSIYKIPLVSGQQITKETRETFQISHWSQPHYPLTPPKKRRHPSIYVQKVPLSQTFS